MSFTCTKLFCVIFGCISCVRPSDSGDPVLCSQTPQVARRPKCRFYIHREAVAEAADQIQSRSRELTAGQVIEADCSRLRADHTHTHCCASFSTMNHANPAYVARTECSTYALSLSLTELTSQLYSFILWFKKWIWIRSSVESVIWMVLNCTPKGLIRTLWSVTCFFSAAYCFRMRAPVKTTPVRKLSSQLWLRRPNQRCIRWGPLNQCSHFCLSSADLSSDWNENAPSMFNEWFSDPRVSPPAV